MGDIVRYACTKYNAESSKIYKEIGRMGLPVSTELNVIGKRFIKGTYSECHANGTIKEGWAGMWD